MPNWVSNNVKFYGTKEDIRKLLSEHLGLVECETDGIWYDTDKFTFNNIVPEPKVEDDCDKTCVVPAGERETEEFAGIGEDGKAIMKKAERPWFDWYSWHLKHWGTKWDACEAAYCVSPKMECVNLMYRTAWSPATPIIEKLSELYPGLIIELVWSDEFEGNGCGKMKFFEGKQISDMYYDMSERCKIIPNIKRICKKMYDYAWGYSNEDAMNRVFLDKTIPLEEDTEKEG